MIIQFLIMIFGLYAIMKTAEGNGAIFFWTKIKYDSIDLEKEIHLLGNEDAKQQA